MPSWLDNSTTQSLRASAPNTECSPQRLTAIQPRAVCRHLAIYRTPGSVLVWRWEKEKDCIIIGWVSWLEGLSGT